MFMVYYLFIYNHATEPKGVSLSVSTLLEQQS